MTYEEAIDYRDEILRRAGIEAQLAPPCRACGMVHGAPDCEWSYQGARDSQEVGAARKAEKGRPPLG